MTFICRFIRTNAYFKDIFFDSPGVCEKPNIFKRSSVDFFIIGIRKECCHETDVKIISNVPVISFEEYNENRVRE